MSQGESDPAAGEQAGGPRVVTFTANPSVDRTIALCGHLERGEVQRAADVVVQAGGKGVNVARVVAGSGVRCLAVLPFRDEGYLSALGATRPDLLDIEVAEAAYLARTNTAITEPDGVTTKINEPGPTLDADDLARAATRLIDAARGAAWVVLAGALPPGAPADWYATLVAQLKPLGVQVAVDTSDAPLDAVLAALPEGAFDLIKPNSDELAQLTGGDAAAFEAAAAAGDVGDIVDAAASLCARGVTNVLVTLGGSGAVLVTADGAWRAEAPKVSVKSTVGAGDSSVAGFILADVAAGDRAACLARAVSYGSAAASLPGTGLPTPADLPSASVVVTPLH